MTKPSRYFSFLLLMALLGFTFLLTDHSFSHATAAENTSAVHVTKAFYQRYMLALARNDFDQIKPDRLRKYLTPGLVDLLKESENSKEGLDEDYFIKAQDYLDDWVTHIQAREIKATQNSADISVTLGESEPQRLEVYLEAQNHRWWINRVQISRIK